MFTSPTIYNAVAHSLYSPRLHLSSLMEHSRLIFFSSCDFSFDCFRGLLFFEEPSESVSLSSGDTCAGVAFSKENVQKMNVPKSKKELRISTKSSNRVVLTVLDILGRSF